MGMNEFGDDVVPPYIRKSIGDGIAIRLIVENDEHIFILGRRCETNTTTHYETRQNRHQDEHKSQESCHERAFADMTLHTHKFGDGDGDGDGDGVVVPAQAGH